MAEYDIEFADRLTLIAKSAADDDMESINAMRATLYLSMLAIEISLKALLEKAGFPVPHIRSRSHNLDALMTDICHCEIQKKVGSRLMWVSAAALKAVTVSEGEASATVGKLLEDSPGKSKYPGGIRYGEELCHYPPALMLDAANAILNWAELHMTTIRRKTKAP